MSAGQKFHYNPTLGKFLPCNAQDGNCPFDLHVDSKEEGEKILQTTLQRNYVEKLKNTPRLDNSAKNRELRNLAKQIRGLDDDKEFKSFCRKFKNLLQKNLLGCELEGFEANHFTTSGFVSNPATGRTVYISISDLRFWDNALDKVLYRTAKDTKDYTGGWNQFARLEDLPSRIEDTLIR